MHRLPLLMVALAVLVAPPASAATFGELPFQPVAGDATCLRATGAPGELVRSTPSGAQLLQASASGLQDSAAVTLGRHGGECPVAAARRTGAGVLAQATGADDGAGGLWVATREAGGGWAPAAPLAEQAQSPAVAESAAGTAIVGWIEPQGGRYLVRVARRPAGGAFEPAATLAAGRAPDGVRPTLALAVAAAGETVALWSEPSTAGKGHAPVFAAFAPAGAAFGPAQRVGETAVAAAPALAVAPDGRALAAFWTGEQVQVAERAPGGAFGAPVMVAAVKDAFVTLPAVAIRAGGGAVVGWYGLVAQDVRAAVRQTVGGFGAPVTLAPRQRLPGVDDDTLLFFGLFAPLGGYGPIGASSVPPDGSGGDLRASVTADGRALLTWNGVRTGAVPGLVSRAAALPLAGGHLDRLTFGGLRVPGSVTAVALADGRPAVAWADDRAQTGGAGRVHLAVEGVADVPDAPAPDVSVGAPSRRVLSGRRALRLPVTCNAACDVRALLPDHPEVTATVSLDNAGRGVLELAPQTRPIAPPKPGPVRVRLFYGAPGAKVPVARTVSVTLSRPPGHTPPRVLDLRAVRRGKAIEVSWRTDVPAATGSFLVTAAAERPPERAILGLAANVRRHGRLRFSARIRAGRDARFVTVRVTDELLTSRRVTTEVR